MLGSEFTQFRSSEPLECYCMKKMEEDILKNCKGGNNFIEGTGESKRVYM